jgi:hypothetical protein
MQEDTDHTPTQKEILQATEEALQRVTNFYNEELSSITHEMNTLIHQKEDLRKTELIDALSKPE